MERTPAPDAGHRQPVVLELPADAAFASVVLAAAQAAGKAFGLDQDRVLRLKLAVEEFFVHFAAHLPGRSLRIRLADHGPFVRAEFRFQAREVNLRALNITARPTPHGEDLSEMGLLLAARTTDRFFLKQGEEGAFVLSAEVDRSHVAADPLPAPRDLAPPWRMTTHPGPDLLRHAAMIARGLYDPAILPNSFRTPGLLVDRVKAGLHGAVCVMDRSERPAGLLVWRNEGLAARFSGPYVVPGPQASEVATLLVEGMLQALARSETVCAVSERATAELPRDYFERLGELGGERLCPVYYRALGEDMQASVWAHPDLIPFLRAEYRRLGFMRDILPAAERESPLRAYCLLSTHVDRNRKSALILPLLDGVDLGQALEAHVAELRGRGLGDILLHLDLAHSRQAALAPEILRAGFAPRLILPHVGDADLVVFQHAPISC